MLLIAMPCAMSQGDDPFAEELGDAPSAEVILGDEKKRYFLIGPLKGQELTEGEYKLAVILPGGDGSAQFNPFVRRIFKHALGPGWIVAQPIAVKWTADQKIVWPTKTNPVEGQEFSTEELVEAVIADVKGRYTIDNENIVTMSWSSSGPAAYAISLTPDTSVTASYVVMSVFTPQWLPDLEGAKGHRYYIEHSPDDGVCPYRDAVAARKTLRDHGATVMASDYVGGHGWHGDIFGNIRSAMTWLTMK